MSTVRRCYCFCVAGAAAVGIRRGSRLAVRCASTQADVRLSEVHVTLSEAEWRQRSSAHAARVASILGAEPEIAAKDKRNPLTNFIFTYYYGFKPRDLSKWSPGPNVALMGAREQDLARGVWLGDDLVLDPPVLLKRDPMIHARATMAATLRRPPVWNCYGFHEWAMVYKQEKRHQKLPLRVTEEVLNDVVETPGALRCTHLDAFRFFSDAARPLNTPGPTELLRERQPENEQPGCIHATMDLFKYALKLGPFLPAEQMADALELAFDARAVDMRASPYDISEFDGYHGIDLSPIRVETAEGRKEYTFKQADLMARAQPIRAKLVEAYDDLLKL